MKLLFPNPGALAAELVGVLLAYPGEYFSPGELVATLRMCPSWSEYLAEFETDRGQPAAVGRFLNELGVTKNAHHRTRGSLYSSQACLTRLQGVLDEARQQRAEVREAAAADPDLQIEPVNELPTAAAAVEAPPLRRRADDAAPIAMPAAVASSQPVARATDAPGGRIGGPGIAWRRRATDLARSPRPQAAAAAAGLGAPAAPGFAAPLPAVIPGYGPGFGYASAPGAAPAAAPAPAPAPVWIGGGATMAPGPAGVPVYPIPYGSPELTLPATTGEEESGLPLGFYWHQIRRHLYKIILAAALVTGLVGMYTLRIPKQYQAIATLQMDFRAPVFNANAQSGDGSSDAFDPSTLIQTKVTDVHQRAVILDAITTAHLDQDASLRRQAGGSRSGALPTVADPQALQNSLVDLIAAHLTAANPDNTHNIDISYQSLDPNTSAAVANALGTALIKHEYDTLQQEQDASLIFMQKQMGNLQSRMETEQKNLTDYQHQNNILNPDGQSSLEQSTVTTLNNTYLQAQADLTRYQAEINTLDSGALTSGAAASGNAASHGIDALLASDDGAVLRPTFDAWRSAAAKFEQIKTTRGAKNPEYVSADQAVSQAKQALDTAVVSVRNQINLQYTRAQNQFQLVGKQLATAQQKLQSFNDKAIDYNNQKRGLDDDQKLYDDLNAQIKQQQLSSTLTGSNLRVTNPATPIPIPVYPSVRKNVSLALMFSLFGGCALAILAGYMDRSFTSPEGVEQYLRVPLLGALPEIANKSNPIELADQPPEADLVARGKATPRSAFAESILMLRTAVLYAAPHGIRTLSITSAQPQEGKSVIIANLAISLALHGSKVLLVDGDIRRPTQHRIFDAPNNSGLSNLLRQTAPIEDCFRATTVEKLYLMPAGPAVPNPSELVATMLAQVLGPLTAEFDYVLVDSPPVLGFADAVSISTVVEGTVLVARAGKTRRDMVMAALQPLKRVRARVLGLVLNQVSSSLSPYYSYYRDHYSRYYGGRDDADAQPEAEA